MQEDLKKVELRLIQNLLLRNNKEPILNYLPKIGQLILAILIALLVSMLLILLTWLFWGFK